MKVFASALSVFLLGCTSTTQGAFVTNPHKASLKSNTKLNVLKSGSKGTGEGWLDRPAAPVNSEESLKKTLEESLKGASFQKRISLLGSTGSIGTQTLDIVDACPENFVVDALSAGNNAELMCEQVLKYKPKVASLATEAALSVV